MPIRLAQASDLAEIVAIYNASIPGRLATADLEPVTVEARVPWFREFDPARRPLWVHCETPETLPRAWLSLRSFYGRPAYHATAEIAVYTAPAAQRRGVARALLRHAIDSSPGLGLRTLLAFVFGHNAPSVTLFRAHGFTEWGLLPRVAELDGVERDLADPGIAASGARVAMTPPGFRIAFARREDVADLHALIRALADYERLADMCVSTPADIEAALFGPRPLAEALIARKVAVSGPAVGFALFFHTFSTFRGRPSLWLEDLFVRPEVRGAGLGRALLLELAAIARERRCARFEWAVLDWNTTAIGFYEKQGAVVLPDWRIARVTGEALETLAARRGEPGTTSTTPS